MSVTSTEPERRYGAPKLVVLGPAKDLTQRALWRLPGAAQPYAVYVDDRDVVWLTRAKTPSPASPRAELMDRGLFSGMSFSS